MKTINLSASRPCPNKGRYVALVDDSDYERLIRHNWSAQVLVNGTSRQVYARRIEYTCSQRRFIMMHAEIWSHANGAIPKGFEIDHIEAGKHKGLDNRRGNLRLASRSHNMANVGLRVTNKSGFKGVWWDESRGLWQAKIKVSYKAINLGRHVTAEDAARAYDAAAIAHFGEFASLNFPRAGAA